MISVETARGWLAGFVDGEGCIYFRKAKLANGKHHQHRVITITNTDKALVDFAAECFASLGIYFSRSDRPGATKRHKHRYLIEIRRAPAMARFRDLIPIQAPEKKRRLDLALASVRSLYCAGCGCLHDEETLGCYNCKKRHSFRRAYRRSQERKKAKAA